MLMKPRHWVAVRTPLVSPLSGTTVCVLATWTSFAGSSSRLFAIMKRALAAAFFCTSGARWPCLQLLVLFFFFSPRDSKIWIVWQRVAFEVGELALFQLWNHLLEIILGKLATFSRTHAFSLSCCGPFRIELDVGQLESYLGWAKAFDHW